MSVGGATNLLSTLTVAGKAEFDDAVCVSGNTILVGNLTVGGTTTIGGATSIAGALSVGGATNLLSTMTVAGKAEFDDDVCVSGNSILVGNLTVGGTTTIGGAVSIAGAISVGGAANFGKTVLAKTDTAGSQTGSVTLDFATNQNFVLTFTGNAANAVDVIPYFVKAAGSIQLGAVQLAFS